YRCPMGGSSVRRSVSSRIEQAAPSCRSCPSRSTAGASRGDSPGRAAGIEDPTGGILVMAHVVVKDLFKRYGDFQAVHGINFEIDDGEFVVLVGPSGCGKSTILRMIAGLETVTAGDILIDGEVVNDTPPRERDIAMVFQDY